MVYSDHETPAVGVLSVDIWLIKMGAPSSARGCDILVRGFTFGRRFYPERGCFWLCAACAPGGGLEGWRVVAIAASSDCALRVWEVHRRECCLLRRFLLSEQFLGKKYRAFFVLMALEPSLRSRGFLFLQL